MLAIDVYSASGSILHFTGSSTLNVCENATATTINSNLTISDGSPTGTVETYTVTTNPAHGVLGGFSASTTISGSAATPTGCNYTPTGSYSGSDMFVITVSNGTSTATQSVTVTVASLPSAAYSVSANPVCAGTTTTFASGAPLCSVEALSLSGTTALGQAAALISTATSSVTMEAWVNWNGGGGTTDQMIMSNGNSAWTGYTLYQNSGLLKVVLGNVIIMASGYTLTPNTWTHVALVCSSTDVWTMYVNGASTSLSNSSATPFTPSASSHPAGFYVGNDPNTANQVFQGQIDNAMFWNTARTGTQVGSDMIACDIAPQTGLVGYWPFNEGTGATAYDASGNGNNLTLTGTSWVAATETLSTYAWTFGDGASSVVNNIAHTYTVAATYTPTLVVTNSSGCTNQATVSVTVNPSPAGITGVVNLPAETTTTLGNTVSGGIWTSGSTAVATAGTGTGMVTGVTAGSSIISYTLADGCLATTTLNVSSGAALIWYSATVGGDASNLSNWWSNNTSTGYQPTLFTTANTTWVIQSAMTGAVALNFGGNVTIPTGGNLTPLASSTTTVGGNWVVTGGTFINNGGTLDFSGANTSNTADTLSGNMTGGNAFNNVTFDGAGSSYFFLASADVNGIYTQSAATVTAPSGNLTVGGNFNHSAGSFAPNGGTVTIKGGSSTITATGMTVTTTNCFNNLSFEATSASTYTIGTPVLLMGNFNNLTSFGTIAAGSATLTVGGNWNNAGSMSGNPIRVNLSGTGIRTTMGNM